MACSDCICPALCDVCPCGELGSGGDMGGGVVRGEVVEAEPPLAIDEMLLVRPLLTLLPPPAWPPLTFLPYWGLRPAA